MTALPPLVAKLQPWPLDDNGARVDGLDISAKIETASGWLSLEDGQFYSLSAETLASRSQSYRKREVTSEWIEGTFPVTAVRDNTVEAVVVYFRGNTAWEFRQNQLALTDALEALSFQFMFRQDNLTEYWQCFVSDYTVEVQHEFRHALLGVVRAQIPRLPEATVVYAAGDDY